MNYYELSYSTDLNLTGEIPQVSNVEITGSNESVDNLMTYFKHPDFEPVLKGRKRLKAQFTDLMSCTGLSTGKGLLVNEKFYKLANQYQLPGCKDYLFDIFDAFWGNNTQYHYLHIINCKEIAGFIDFTRSTFYIKKNDDEKEFIKILDWDNWWNSNLLQVEKDGRIINVEQLFINQIEIQFPGILRMPFSAAILISQKLKDELDKNKISGTSFKKSNLTVSSIYESKI